MWRQVAYLSHQVELINAGGVDDEQVRKWLCQLQIADCLIRLDDVALFTQMRKLQSVLARSLVRMEILNGLDILIGREISYGPKYQENLMVSPTGRALLRALA